MAPKAIKKDAYSVLIHALYIILRLPILLETIIEQYNYLTKSVKYPSKQFCSVKTDFIQSGILKNV